MFFYVDETPCLREIARSSKFQMHASTDCLRGSVHDPSRRPSCASKSEMHPIVLLNSLNQKVHVLFILEKREESQISHHRPRSPLSSTNTLRPPAFYPSMRLGTVTSRPAKWERSGSVV